MKQFTCNEIIHQYSILEEKTPELLSILVNKNLHTGEWFLVGSPYSAYDSERGLMIHHQAMINITENSTTKNITKLDFKKKKL